MSEYTGPLLPPTPRRPPKKRDFNKVALPEKGLDFWKENTKLLAEAKRVLTACTRDRVTEHEVGEHINQGIRVAWARYLGSPDAKTAWQAATAWKIFLEAWRLVHGQSTQITEERRMETTELLSHVSMLLQARRPPPPEILEADVPPKAR